MSIFHQIGNDSINLVREKELGAFAGLIWSPVNYTESSVIFHNKKIPQGFTKALDPQLYCPGGEKKQLQSWAYYPSDFETADQTNPEFWNTISIKLIETCIRTGCDTLMSPVMIPRFFSLDYYAFCIDNGDYTFEKCANCGVTVFQSVLVRMDDLLIPDSAEKIASIVSRTKTPGIYLVFASNITPRRELSNPDHLLEAMKLIHLLKVEGRTVIVGFCSTDLLLWRYAGADSVATGKFFNLRRFTATRFVDGESGGSGQLAYLLDDELLAFLREIDVARLFQTHLLSQSIVSNPYSKQIIEFLSEHPGEPWVALSWRSYLYDAMRFESMYEPRDPRIVSLLDAASRKWNELSKNKIVLAESANNGNWIKQWRRAITSFDEYVAAMI